MNTFGGVLNGALWTAAATALKPLPAESPLRGSLLESVLGDAAIVPVKELDFQLDGAARAVATLLPAEPLRDVFVLTGKVPGLRPEGESVALVGYQNLMICMDRGSNRSFLTPARLRMRFEAKGDSGVSAEHPMVAFHKFDGRADHFSHLALESLSDPKRIVEKALVAINRRAVETSLDCFRRWPLGIKPSLADSKASTNPDVPLLGALFYARACGKTDPTTRRELARTYLEEAEASDPVSKMKFIGALASLAQSDFPGDREGLVAFLNELGACQIDHHLSDVAMVLGGLKVSG